MAKKGMHRADNIYDKNKNRAEIVPELQGGAKLSNEKANPIIAGTQPPSQKVYHSKPHSEMTRPPKVRPKKSNFGGRYFYVKIQL